MGKAQPSENSRTAASCEPLPLLEAGRRIAEQADLQGAIAQTLRACCEVLGYERALFYRAYPAEAVLRLAACEGVETDRPCVREIALTQDTLPGRMALRGMRAQAAPQYAISEPDEGSGGLPACVAALRLGRSVLGVVVADRPRTGQGISQEQCALLDALLSFARVAIERGQLSAMREQFVASVSHELRTPLTSIKAFCEMLEDGDAGPLAQQQLDFVRRIATGSAQLEKIVEDLLELSRLRSGAAQIEEKPIRLQPFLQDLALLLAPQATARSMRLVVAVPDGLPPLCTDQRRLQQALSNFVDNAIKYSPEGSEVTLEAQRANGDTHLRVRDEGPGIPQGELRRIFEEFYRCRNRVNDTANRGAGLGLSIVARIADMLGAKVEVESAPAVGSTFSLIFPAGAV